MEKLEIITVLKNNLCEIIPELETVPIDLDKPLDELGLNSIDRGELITLTLETLESDSSRITFVKAQTINELADLFYNSVHT